MAGISKMAMKSSSENVISGELVDVVAGGGYLKGGRGGQRAAKNITERRATSTGGE